MKNKILFNYLVSDKFLELVGIDRNEVYDYHDERIYFNRNNKNFLLRISDNYFDSKQGDVIHLELIDPKEGLLGYGFTIFQIRNIKQESDFEKFRNLFKEYLKEPLIIDCDDIINNK